MNSYSSDKIVLNVLKYGTPNPNFIQKLVKNIFGSGHVLTNNSHSFWTAIYHYSRASKSQLLHEGYAKNATVYSIISLISKTCALAPRKIYRIKNKSSYNRLKALRQNPYSAKNQLEINIAKEESLEPFDSHYLNELFNNPNPYQSGSEYIENIIAYKLITGDFFELAEFDERKKNILNFWVMPSDKVQILTEEYATFPMRELGYVLNVGGKEITYGADEVNHGKYWNPYFYGDGSHLYGFSPLESAWLSTLQSNTAKEAAIEQLQNRGVRGIFSIENNAINNYDDMVRMAGDFHEKWQQGSKNYKDRIFPIMGRGQWHNVGLSTKDMAIIELSNLTDKDLCNVYNISDVLLNNSQSSTYDNYKQARKDLITKCVLTALTSYSSSINKKLKPYGDWNKTNERLVCEFDTTIYTELFEDVWQMAKDMREVGAYTDNEIRIATNYERIENPLMDEVWKRTSELPMSMVSKENFNNNNKNNEL